jgi:hypothetical protein
MLHRTRQLFIRQQASVINAIRAHLGEFGIVAAVGRKGVEQLHAVVRDTSDRSCLRSPSRVSPPLAPSCGGSRSSSWSSIAGIWAGADHGSSPASKGQLVTTSTKGSCDSSAA